MASAAAVDGKSFDRNFAKSPILNSLHGRSPRQPHDEKQDDPMLAATDSAHHAPPPPLDQSSPQEILEYYTWKSPMPRLFVKHAPTTATPTSLLKWANLTIRRVSTPVVTLNLVLFCFNKHASGSPMETRHLSHPWRPCGGWSLATYQACRQSAVYSNCYSTHSCLTESLHPISPEWFCHHSCASKRLLALLQCVVAGCAQSCS